MPSLEEINAYLNRHVPLFQAMQARLEHCDDNGLRMRAPLEPNINDKGIAFGGSMAAIAALTGWALTRITLGEHDEQAEIVITEGVLKFLRPVRGEIVTECKRPQASISEGFIESYRRRGKARWTVEVVVWADGEKAMTFTGHYAIFRAEASSS
ncbi:MAG: YiiD C-terminal domain-containing protein [Candidatus Contendobacter sp.]